MDPLFKDCEGALESCDPIRMCTRLLIRKCEVAYLRQSSSYFLLLGRFGYDLRSSLSELSVIRDRGVSYFGRNDNAPSDVLNVAGHTLIQL